MNYRETPPVNWTLCGPPGVIGYNELKSKEMAEAQEQREHPQNWFKIPEANGICKVCGKPLPKSNYPITIHVGACEDEAFYLSRPWIKRKAQKKYDPPNLRYDPSML